MEGVAERINHKLMRCECRSFCQLQHSLASLTFFFSFVCGPLQLLLVASLTLLFHVMVSWFFISPLALLVQTKQIRSLWHASHANAISQSKLHNSSHFIWLDLSQAAVKETNSESSSPTSAPLGKTNLLLILPLPLRMCFQFGFHEIASWSC